LGENDGLYTKPIFCATNLASHVLADMISPAIAAIISLADTSCNLCRNLTMHAHVYKHVSASLRVCFAN
ncbi:hypothetical protein KCU73_g169, partial [Aureobasidium melanogenum]